MRIAMISTPFVSVPPRRYGGTELIVGYLVEALQRAGHDVTLFATGDSRTSAALRYEYETPHWPPDPLHGMHHVACAVGEIAAADPPFDVVHGHLAPILSMARFLDAPAVYTLHHDRDEELASFYERAAASSTCVAISARQRELLVEAGAEHVVHHGVDPARYPLGAGAGGYAVFLGRLAEVKGPDRAIEAALAAGVPLRVAGEPHWADKEFFARAVAPQLGRAGISWMGEVGHGDKVELLAGGVATLFPIAWEEPFGLVMIESMLCGTPVLAFGRGAVPEVVDEGVTGFVVGSAGEMAERLRELSRGGRFDRVRCRARAAERFSAERMAREYLAIYEWAGAAASPWGLPIGPHQRP